MRLSSRRSFSTGFTLLELVVVIGILAFITFFTAVAFSNGEGKRLEAGQRIATNFLQMARTQAVLYAGVDARKGDDEVGAWLLIHDDPRDVERYRRYFGVIYRDAEASGWIAGSQGVALPKGVYVSEALGASGRPHDVRVYLDYPLATTDADLSQGGVPWIAYGFQSTGAFMHSGARIILGTGYYVPETHTWKSQNPHARVGFAVWRSGAVSPLGQAQ